MTASWIEGPEPGDGRPLTVSAAAPPAALPGLGAPRLSPSFLAFAGIGTPRQIQRLATLVWAVLALNVVDGVLTLHWIELGWAVEANPLLAELAHNHPLGFVLTKMSLVALGSVILYRNRHRASAVVGIFVVFLAYYGVLLVHLRALDARLLERASVWAGATLRAVGLV